MAVHIYEKRWDEEKRGNIITFLMDSVSDVNNLPKPGEWAAITSIAIDWSTFDVYKLGETSWQKGGQG